MATQSKTDQGCNVEAPPICFASPVGLETKLAVVAEVLVTEVSVASEVEFFEEEGKCGLVGVVFLL